MHDAQQDDGALSSTIPYAKHVPPVDPSWPTAYVGQRPLATPAKSGVALHGGTVEEASLWTCVCGGVCVW